MYIRMSLLSQARSALDVYIMTF